MTMAVRGERTQVLADVGTRSRTKQAPKAETDINLMVGRYKKTGEFRNVNPKQPRYGDFSEAVSLEEAFQQVADANQSFMQLPARVRALAQNDPITLLEMLADEGATAALVEAGLPVKQAAPAENVTSPSVGENPAPASVGAPAGGGVTQTN